jgi:hypothetical protein
MEQLRSFADERLISGCIHCAGPTETRDHVPSRILLDEPYPENLPVVPACASCNAGFSLDEEYFTCLVECARTGSAEAVERTKIKRILQNSPSLASRLSHARTVADDGGISFAVEQDRVKNIVLKLARGHAAFEFSEPQYDPPSHILFAPLTVLNEEVRRHFEGQDFETLHQPSFWPEIGSRAMQRLVVSIRGIEGPDG